jgi:outer membrane protein OmpA-like peptidoglycan-associated protein
MVYFDYNKASLSADGHAVVSEAVEAYKATGSATIEAQGDGDAPQLGERRGAAIKGAMVSLGVPPSAISVEPHGASATVRAQ